MKSGNTRLKLFSLLTISILCFTLPRVSADCVTTPYPPGKVGHSMTYDPINDLVIVYGGAMGSYKLDRKYDTRSYDVNNNEWTKLTPAEHPYSSMWGSIVYDTESDKIVQFGGIPQNDWASDETWIYDYESTSWTNAEPSIHPERRSTHAMAYDSESDVVIIQGGQMTAEYNPGGVFVKYNDTWAYDYNSNTWSNMTPTGLSVGISEGQMTYDSESDRCILVGGYFVWPYDDPQEEYHVTETWVYDYNSNTWENVTTTPHPQYRYDHSVAYDSESDRVILFGGWIFGDEGVVQNETWAFDYNTKTWEKMEPIYSPRRIAHQMVYDSANDLIILFGGLLASDLTGFYNNIFTFDYNSNNWTLMPSTLCPTPTETNFYHYPTLIVSAVLIVISRVRRRKK